MDIKKEFYAAVRQIERQHPEPARISLPLDRYTQLKWMAEGDTAVEKLLERQLGND